jgi:hypothetical protein
MPRRKAGAGVKSEKPIPEPTEELKAQCNADNQFRNFERVFRSAMSVPKAEVLKREAKEMHRNARKRARKKKG